jgi:hypothetical protein
MLNVFKPTHLARPITVWELASSVLGRSLQSIDRDLLDSRF